MTFTLSKEQYDLLKSINFAEIKDSVSFDDASLSIVVAAEKVRTFQVIIDEEIDVKGLSDDQEQVTPYGRRLYALYDAIYAQIHKED